LAVPSNNLCRLSALSLAKTMILLTISASLLQNLLIYVSSSPRIKIRGLALFLIVYRGFAFYRYCLGDLFMILWNVLVDDLPRYCYCMILFFGWIIFLLDFSIILRIIFHFRPILCFRKIHLCHNFDEFDSPLFIHISSSIIIYFTKLYANIFISAILINSNSLFFGTKYVSLIFNCAIII